MTDQHCSQMWRLVALSKHFLYLNRYFGFYFRSYFFAINELHEKEF